MSILFSVVADKSGIIHEHASRDGNFVDIANEILCKIPLKNNKMTYLHGHYLFNYVVENEQVFLCVTEKVSFLFIIQYIISYLYFLMLFS